MHSTLAPDGHHSKSSYLLGQCGTGYWAAALCVGACTQGEENAKLKLPY